MSACSLLERTVSHQLHAPQSARNHAETLNGESAATPRARPEGMSRRSTHCRVTRAHEIAFASCPHSELPRVGVALRPSANESSFARLDNSHGSLTERCRTDTLDREPRISSNRFPSRRSRREFGGSQRSVEGSSGFRNGRTAVCQKRAGHYCDTCKCVAAHALDISMDSAKTRHEHAGP